MKLTPQQEQAVTKEGNLIVSAAAGAGKTAVLTQRLCRLVASGTPVDRLLVLTFTRAAAGEMKERIAARLMEMSMAEPDREKAKRLAREADGAARANISTIDAFCTRVLKRSGHVLGLPMALRVADETELAALADSARDSLLTRLAQQEDPGLRELLAVFGSEDALWEAVTQLSFFLDAQPDPKGWLNGQLQAMAAPEYAGRLLAAVAADMQRELGGCLRLLEREREGLPPELAAVASLLDGELTRYRGMLLMPDYGSYRAAVLDMDYQTLRFPKEADPDTKQAVQAARDGAKKCIRSQAEAMARTETEEREALSAMAGSIALLGEMTLAYREEYTRKKREKNAADFADVEHLALEALENEAVAREYREKFEYIAVDEYQDTNRVGEAILDRVRREDNVFLVGDVKQSIYRFRQAEPGLFLEKLRSFTGRAGARIDLNMNFRSAGEVLEAVNDLFSAIMSVPAGEMEYDGRARLYPGAELPPGGAELHLIEREPGEEDEALQSAGDAEVEARLAAVRIRELMDRETYLDPRTGQARPLRYGDFAVLMRGMKHAETVTRTLSRLGIPAYAQSGGGYFDAVEVALVMNALRLVDNPWQDTPLIAVLLCGMGGFTAQRLMEMRLSHREGPFYEAFFACEDGDAAAFRSRLSAWREEARFCPVSELIARILEDTGFGYETACLPGGAQRLANLQELIAKARSFEASGESALAQFLRRMDLARSNVSLGAAQTVSADVVRVMSMHKSKGLEFPVTLILGLGTKFNLDDLKRPLLIHPQEGLALRRIDPETGRRVDAAARRVLARRLKESQLAEEMRILYVAMTRARHRLVMVGCARRAGQLLGRGEPRPGPEAVLSAASPLAWLTMGTRAHLPAQLHARAEFLSLWSPPPAQGLPASDPALLTALSDRFGWRYPYFTGEALPAKASASHMGREEELSFQAPAFAGDERAAAASRGTAMHAALMRLPLRELEPRDAAAFVEELIHNRQLTREQGELVDTAMLSAFTKSSLYRRMGRAPSLQREVPFHWPVPAQSLYPTDSNEPVLLQGVIDACFMEEGQWVLLDYKTDRVPPGVTAKEAAQRHRTQLSLYAQALAALTGRPVKEAYVVLLSIGQAVELGLS